jgi:polyisoprenyl-teichoic acid--peptidoglycan teichoic acid transferase
VSATQLKGVAIPALALTALVACGAPAPSPTLVPTASRSPSVAPSPTATASPTAAAPTESPAGTDAGPTAPPATPSARPSSFPPIDAAWAEDGRLDLLLLGTDAGPGRFSLRTDAMILLSIEVETGRSALFGFPRNMIGVPLPAESAGAYPGGKFPEFLLGLWRRAMEQPGNFPGDDEERGWRAIRGAIGELSGLPVDGMVAVNLNGFVDLVDEMGGLWIDVPRRVREARYPLQDGKGHLRLNIRRGCQLLDGTLALAYGRTRHQDSDYFRMARQQVVLTAMRRQFDPLAMLPRLPRLLEIADDNLWVFIDDADVMPMVEVVGRSDADLAQRFTFVPPDFTSPLDDREIRLIRRTVRNVFDRPAPKPTPTPSGSPRPSCPPEP